MVGPDRLAQHIADSQDEPLEYANLAIRGWRMKAIRAGQLDDAMALRPDLLTVFGGVNDVIGPRYDFDSVRANYVIVFGEARRAGCTVLTFTMPDPAAINPLAAGLRERVRKLNAIIRSEAEAWGVLLVDFESYPVAADPRLWYEDRLHGNTLGHIMVAAALAWRLGLPGFDESWAEPRRPSHPRPDPGCRSPMTWTGRCTTWSPGSARDSAAFRLGSACSPSGRCRPSCPGRASGSTERHPIPTPRPLLLPRSASRGRGVD